MQRLPRRLRQPRQGRRRRLPRCAGRVPRDRPARQVAHTVVWRAHSDIEMSIGGDASGEEECLAATARHEARGDSRRRRRQLRSLLGEARRRRRRRRRGGLARRWRWPSCAAARRRVPAFRRPRPAPARCVRPVRSASFARGHMEGLRHRRLVGGRLSATSSRRRRLLRLWRRRRRGTGRATSSSGRARGPRAACAHAARARVGVAAVAERGRRSHRL